MLTMFGFSTVFGYWVIISGCFIGFDNLVAVFGCSIVTGFMLTILGFSKASTLNYYQHQKLHYF